VRVELGARQEIVKHSLRGFEVQLRMRNVDGALALFCDDGALFGSEEDESAIGIDELRDFFARLFARPHTYGWSEFEPLQAGGTDELIWFVAPTAVVIRDEDRNERQAPYRVSGVLELAGNGRWLFRLFNGSEPAAA
jgi:ketosteroid isomerase-like protein